MNMYSNMTRRKRKGRKDSSSSSSNTKDSSTTSGYKRHRDDKRQEEPFLITTLKVAGVLMIACASIYALYNYDNLSSYSNSGSLMTNSEGVWSKYVTDGDGDGSQGQGQDGQDYQVEEEDLTKIQFPVFDLGENTKYDSWGMMEELFEDKDNKKNNKYAKFFDKVDEIQNNFAQFWGGENAARKVLEMGLISFSPRGAKEYTDTKTDMKIPAGIRSTARRILEAHKNKRPFRISFAGAAAVSGRGNFLEDSFPHVVKLILKEPFQKLGIELDVRNAAIADINSFPYGWCLKNFLGDEADVVSWDPELTSRGDTMATFEAYLRNAITMKHSPMMVIREYSYTKKRRELLQKYVDLGAMSDPIVINIAAAVDPFKDLDESIIPPAYQNWEEFGGPPGAPGKTRTNISLRQHELIGEMLSLHFLAAAELVVAHLLKLVPKDFLDVGQTSKPSKYYLLPPPQSSDLDDDPISRNTTIMFGSPVPADQNWYMNNVNCRTSFDPVIFGELNETIISGTDAEDISLLLPRGAMQFNKHWVMDYAPSAKLEANSVKQYDFGYKDRRKGYFGVKPSKTLSMFIPYELDETITKYAMVKDKKPNEAFKSIILCEVNERAECKMEDDLSFVIGGEVAEVKKVQANGVSYNGRKNCVSMEIPDNVSWSTRKISAGGKGGLLRKTSIKEEMGVTLDIAVSNELLFWKNGPCSISHLVWEQVRQLL